LKGYRDNKKKRIVLFLVEGRSEINALSDSLADLYDDGNTTVIFARLFDKGEECGGDITAKYGVDSSNIERMLNKLFITPAIQKNKIRSTDVKEIIQIIDMDGAYIDNDLIVESLIGGGHYLYNETELQVSNKEMAIERNERKRDNIDWLVGTTQIRLDEGNEVNYSIYFFSSNLDHYLYGEANLSANEKIKRATEFSNACFDDEEKFIDEICNRPSDLRTKSYKKSWSFIKKDNNSLKSYSNLSILVKRLLNY